MKKALILWVVACGSLACAGGRAAVQSAATPAPAGAKNIAVSKQESLDRLRQRYAAESFRSYKRKTRMTVEECMALLDDDGVFSDLRETEQTLRKEGADQSNYSEPQTRVSKLNTEAFNRLWILSETLRGKDPSTLNEIKLRKTIFKGFVHYAAFEGGRANVSGGRFHASCFAIPLANVNSYFCFFKDMERVENGQERNPLFVQANQAMKTMGMQSWTQPYREDETDNNIVSVERFRKHVWWVGGNALAYRPVLQAAFMMNSIPMVDVMAEVAKGAISPVSHTTYEDAFWTEGFTADGAGWGHGRQCLIWGYPIDGGGAALSILNILHNSPWAQQLERPNVDTVLNFVRGSSWYYYKGFVPPCLSRGNMEYDGFRSIPIKSLSLVKRLLEDWPESLTVEEREELEQFSAEAELQQIQMQGHPPGSYNGSHYFYDNDNLLVKNEDFYWFISMASLRCDGIESSADHAAEYNMYTCDGQTLLMRRGDEAKRALGGFNLTAFPGVTARQGEDRLHPVTNWRGYCSKHNFAAGATRGGENACAGLIFEKMNASAKDGVNDRTGLNDQNTVLYGVKAYKSWFVFGDMLLALGAGITNLEPEQEGDVWTTIDQTLWASRVISPQGAFEHDGNTHQYDLTSRTTIPWVKQESGFVYAVLPEHTVGTVSLTAERRASKWEKLSLANARKKNIPETTDIFQLSINHGRTVSDGTYGYIVYAGSEDPAQVFTDAPVSVLSNTTNLQAAASLDGKVIQAVFYNTNAVLTAGEHIFSVSAPCAFMAEFADEGTLYLTATDAEMNADLKQITVHIDGTRSETISMPAEPHRGKPATVSVPWKQPTGADVDAFAQMKFGMFIHWGLYAVPAGEWKGKSVRGIGEWIMNFEKIPVSEYEQLATQFNPVKFNADEWVQLAADAGMKYMVITAKHHDGFAMFDSAASDYNIVKATPFKKDPMEALAQACEQQGVKFGFYYSQAQDWHEPNAAGNDWDFPEERDPAPYIKNKLLPQVEELLSGYGDLAMIWFDTPRLLSREQVIELRKTVKTLQPHCLVNSRIGHAQGDFDQTGDNSIPTQVRSATVWEVPATLNDTWGYKKNDHAWKDPRDLICKMADIVSKGGNYLLNVGPDAEGVIPLESQRILREIGQWMAVNGESIYGTTHSPFNVNGITWRCTAKPGKLYLHMINWPENGFELKGLETHVTAVRFLSDGQPIPFHQEPRQLSLTLPAEAPDRNNTVIVLELAEEQAAVAKAYRYDTDPPVRQLYAWEARMRGEEFHYDWTTQSASNFIDGTRPRNELRWYNFPRQEGEYLVDIEYACDDDKAGSPFRLSSRYSEWEAQNKESSELAGIIEGTGGQFVTKHLGRMKIFTPECALVFGLRDDFKSASVRIRKLVLTRIEDG